MVYLSGTSFTCGYTLGALFSISNMLRLNYVLRFFSMRVAPERTASDFEYTLNWWNALLQKDLIFNAIFFKGVCDYADYASFIEMNGDRYSTFSTF